MSQNVETTAGGRVFGLNVGDWLIIVAALVMVGFMALLI